MTFGNLDFDGRLWRIADLRPHVSIRFKDMFKAVSFGDRPPFVMSDKADRATDLKWFMERYPLDMTDRARARVDESTAAYASMRDQVETLKRPEYTPSLASGFRPPEAPMPYQVRAAEMLRATGRLLLLDDVGLGKTVSALAALSDGWGLPAAVVVQPHLSSQWVKQYIERFTTLRAYEVKDRNPRALPPSDIYLFRYSNIAAWVDMVDVLGIRTVVFDEVQELRHGKSTDKGRGAAAFAESAENVLGLTATPIYNYGSEIWSVVEFISPGALGNWLEFTTNWCRFGAGGHYIVSDPQALGAYLLDEGIALRRTSDDAEVASTLPLLSKTVIEVEWNEGDAATDRELQKRLAMRVLSGHYHDRGQAARELDLLLRQETGIAKAREVAAYVRTLVEAGEPVLLAGWHREVYKIWNEALADLRPVMFTGSESAPQKARARDAIMSGEANIIIMSLRSGAGLDGLQKRISHVVYGEFDWSPQVHTQVTGRLHRTGQPRPVTAHYLHVDGGSDPVIMSTLGLKASQSHGILNPYAGEAWATPTDDSRMKQLARRVLGIADGTP